MPEPELIYRKHAITVSGVSLAKMIEQIQEFQKLHGDEGRIICERFYDEDNIYFYIQYKSLETNEEMCKRIQKENEYKSCRYKQYETLKKEFENA